jgi:hypothetical protein
MAEDWSSLAIRIDRRSHQSPVNLPFSAFPSFPMRRAVRPVGQKIASYEDALETASLATINARLPSASSWSNHFPQDSARRLLVSLEIPKVRHGSGLPV